MNALVDTRREARRRGRMLRIVAPVVVLALVMQLVLGTEPDALLWAAASAAVVLLTLAYCFRPGLIERLPLSTVVLIGTDSVLLGIPLVAQSLCGRSFLYDLHDPAPTFIWIFLTHAVMVGTHAVYAALPALRQPARVLAMRVFAPLTIFRTPTQAELWILGAIGLGATLYTQVSYVNAIEYGDVGGKALAGFSYFSVFPFLIPFRRLFSGGKGLDTLSALPALVAYFGVVLVVALATNKRLTFSFIGLSLIVTVMLFSAMGRLKLSNRAKITIAAVLLVSAPVLGFFENLATAMEMVRGAKGSLSGLGYINATVDQLGDQASIDRWRKDNEAQQSGALDYTEDYIPITLLNRLVFLKYTDLTMTASEYVGDPQRALLKQDFVTRVEALLPTPVAQALGINIDKLSMEHSAGDIYQEVASGHEGASFLTGSSVTYGRDVLGRFWLPGMALIYLLVFNAFDSLVISVRGRLVIAPVAILFLFNLFIHGGVNDSIADLIGDATRGLLQNVILYVVVVTVIRVLLSLIFPSAPTARGARVPAR